MERYVAPDMYMRPLGATLGMLETAGLEVVDVHSLREHYVWTVRPWLDTLQQQKAEAIALIGEEQWRVWLLYLAGGLLAFEENRMGVHQILMVRPDDRGRSGLPRGRTATLGPDPELGHPTRAPGPRSRHDERHAGYPWGAALTNLWVTALVVVATFAITLLVAVRVRGGRHDGIDVVWGLGFAIVAVVTLLLARGYGRPVAAGADHGADVRVGLAARHSHRASQPGQAGGSALRRDSRAGEGQPHSRTWSARSTCRRP